MQTDPRELYRLTSERTGKSEQLYKDIGNFVFFNLYGTMRRPSCLITKLKGVGTWYLRKRRMETYTKLYKHLVQRTRESFGSELDWTRHENKLELLENFRQRLEEYQEYLAIKGEVRELRSKTQVLDNLSNDDENA